jgi:CRP-like cAMP-binding protein
LPLGWTVHVAGEREKHLYFLTAGIVSRFCIMLNGASAAFAVTGREGVIGVASFLGGESTPSQAVVLGAGYGYRLEVDLVNREFERDGPLSHLLLRYTRALIAQTGQIVMCYRHHSLEQQLCRWILSLRGPIALERADDDAATDRRHAGRAPRSRHAGRWKAAEGGADPLQPRPHCRTRSPPAGGTGMRVQMRSSNGNMTVCCARKTPLGNARMHATRRRYRFAKPRPS